MNLKAAQEALKKSPDLMALVAGLNERIDQLERELTKARADIAKARGTAPAPPTVADAIGDAIQKDLARRRSTQVRKTAADGDLHPHFLSDAIATRKARERTDADREIRKAGDDLLQAVRKKAGL